jgi:phytoene desaturase (3,4-didehydrolycopene-forming)
VSLETDRGFPGPSAHLRRPQPPLAASLPPAPHYPGDFEGSWVRATGPDTLARSPNFYAHCPARTDPTAAPPGCESLMVLLPVANIQEVGR